MHGSGPPLLLHATDPAAVLATLDSDPAGLTSAEAARRLAGTGPNRLPEPPRDHALVRLARQFANVLIFVLGAAAVVTAALGHWTDTGVILAVVVLNGVIGFVQEGRAEHALAELRAMMAPRASALRDGRRVGLPAQDLVPGDVVLLEPGERVPADLRLIEARGLRIVESILTGESQAALKSADPVAADAALADRACMAYSGTLVAAGTGRGVVTATGTATEIGRISGLLQSVERLSTPLLRQMDRFSQRLTVVILALSGALLAFGVLAGRGSPADLFLTMVGLAVAAIPEGLPAVLTITLAVAVHRMARRNAIVRRLPAIETIGAVSVICTDKTGTLTRNEMMVATVSTFAGRFVVTGDGYTPRGAIIGAQGPVGPEALAGQGLVDLALAAALCNDAALREEATGWQVEGDPMEGALLALARKSGVGAGDWRRRDAIPFDAAHQFMAVAASRPGGGPGLILVKGAPERVLPMCRAEHRASGDAPLDRAAWQAEALRIAGLGQRVLALALCPDGDGVGDPDALGPAALDGNLRLLGLVGLIDPPRPEAVAAVAECQAAGIAVKMITGDHAGTAAAIAAQIGLAAPDRVMTGADIDRLDDAGLAEAVRDTNVFARTSPEHKLRLVGALQADGLVVAMTGDGVNDAPALRRADAGIAMGRTGSAAAREAAQLVIADDNFASIAAAVREGRVVQDNIRKLIGWILPTNAGEVATIVIALLAGFALPITPVQILWINLVTDATLGLALAFEPGEPGTMRRPPRRRDEPMLPLSLVWHVVLVSVLFAIAVFGIYDHAVTRGFDPAVARTMALNMLVMLEIVHLFFIRRLHQTSLSLSGLRGTRAVWLALAAIVPAQIAITWTPLGWFFLGTAPISGRDAALILAVGVVFLVVLESEKQFRLRLAGARPPAGH